MATEREIQLVEAALKVATGSALQIDREYGIDGTAFQAVDAIRSLDPAAIVASVKEE